eukprot:12645172-Prorocentrum_lima.AAC.1
MPRALSCAVVMCRVWREAPLDSFWRRKIGVSGAQRRLILPGSRKEGVSGARHRLTLPGPKKKG